MPVGVVAQRDVTCTMPIFPSSRGGWMPDQKSCEATFDAQTGWAKTFLTTPSAPIKGGLRRYFLEVASTPPPEEGNNRGLAIFARCATAPTRRRQVSNHPGCADRPKLTTWFVTKRAVIASACSGTLDWRQQLSCRDILMCGRSRRPHISF
jgi:hypothetical protein